MGNKCDTMTIMRIYAGRILLQACLCLQPHFNRRKQTPFRHGVRRMQGVRRITKPGYSKYIFMPDFCLN